MMLIERLKAAGFARILVLDGAECGYPECKRILLALMAYTAEAEPASGDVWIHPYYYASQRAYEAARRIADGEEGVALRDDIRVKPIFARLDCFKQGTNTLSYVEGLGSRFHVQIFSADKELMVTHYLSGQPKALHCGNCTRCVDACPANALEGGVFRRERCIRNWQLNGKPVPVEVRERMGIRLIGCDVCQHVCPHNAVPAEPAASPVPLSLILDDPKEASRLLKPLIGANLAIPNRILSQACIMAGNTGDSTYISRLEALLTHPSPTVREHAAWAAERIRHKNG